MMSAMEQSHCGSLREHGSFLLSTGRWLVEQSRPSERSIREPGICRWGPKQSKRCAMDEDSALGEVLAIRKGGTRDRIELGYCDGS